MLLQCDLSKWKLNKTKNQNSASMTLGQKMKYIYEAYRNKVFSNGANVHHKTSDAKSPYVFYT